MNNKLIPIALVSFLLTTPTHASGPASANVMDYGAVGNGITDDTSAFNDCLSNNQVCWVEPGKAFKVADVKMNEGNRLIGFGSVQYGMVKYQGSSPYDEALKPVLIGGSGNRTEPSIIDTSYVSVGAGIEGITIDCGGQTMNGISGGSNQLTVQDVTIVGCKNGIGGSGQNQSIDSYTSSAHITNSTFGGNEIGVANLVDSFVVNGDFANNSNIGLYLGAGANANTIVNTRFEWNEGPGISSYGGTAQNSISNSFFDRNHGPGIVLIGVESMTISNSSFNRNGSINNAGNDAQIDMYNSSNISITGSTSTVGQDDGGIGVFTPKYIIAYGGTNKNISIAGMATSGKFSSSNPDGSYTVAPTKGQEPTEGYSVVGVNDIPDTQPTVTGITAYSGGGRSNATLLTSTVNTVSTAGANNASVKLTKCVTGRQQTIANESDKPIKVYGKGSDKINGNAAHLGIVQIEYSIATYVCVRSNNWARIMSKD
ncbi:right-handed parallel beta-helix repeat-containing protein [Vibrio nigripulchritudo]|uniref:right-handed parallel beta-helix repeat-containing protein n=1 Tax=Vibrio nigripulchritudo TaxID=28173 RepID=UPI0003B22E6A|nr:right-handed parallel beta-helix repeat-containing protein [Vibrio nigripulchritudo]CCN69864.1 putative Pectin lyase-like [Vibrio nigripulchritudo SFn118]